jgi:hypothetical protein
MEALPFVARDELAWARALIETPKFGEQERTEANIQIDRAIEIARSIEMTDVIERATTIQIAHQASLRPLSV